MDSSGCALDGARRSRRSSCSVCPPPRSTPTTRRTSPIFRRRAGSLDCRARPRTAAGSDLDPPGHAEGRHRPDGAGEPRPGRWSLIPSFAERRMAGGLPISLMNVPAYEATSSRSSRCLPRRPRRGVRRHCARLAHRLHLCRRRRSLPISGGSAKFPTLHLSNSQLGFRRGRWPSTSSIGKFV